MITTKLKLLFFLLGKQEMKGDGEQHSACKKFSQ